MRGKRYLKDYQVTPAVTAKGRLSPVASYIGAYHRFTAEPEAQARAKRAYLILTVAAVLLLGVLLWYSDVLDRERRYLLIPSAFNVFPTFGVVMGVFRFYTAPEKMTLRQRDRICNRLPACSLGMVIFSVLSFAAAVVQLALNGVQLPTALYCADALALSAVSIWIFRLRSILQTEVVSA